MVTIFVSCLLLPKKVTFMVNQSRHTYSNLYPPAFLGARVHLITSAPFFFFLCSSEAGFYITKAALKLLILLPPPAKCWEVCVLMSGLSVRESTWLMF